MADKCQQDNRCNDGNGSILRVTGHRHTQSRPCCRRMFKIQTTMAKSVMPTANACQSAPIKRKFMKGKTAKQAPTKNPNKCPPIIRFGWQEILLGMANTINAVAPILAMMTACSMPRTSVIKNTVTDAYTL